MIYGFVMAIPLIVPILAILNIGVLEIAMIKASFPLKEQLFQFVSFQCNPKTPIYFNYWIIYIVAAIIISIILLTTKKYTLCKTGVVLALNVIAGIMVMHSIITKM